MSPSLQCAADDATPLFDQPPHLFIDVGHSEVPYWRWGAGPDVFFVHGWPLSGATFRHIIPLLAPHFTCHVIDLPGAGASRFDDSTPVEMMRHVDVVLDVARHLNLTQYAMVAHDSGGLIARYAAAQDDAVCGLVLSGTEIPGHHTRFIEDLKRMSRLPFSHRIMRWAFSIPAFARSSRGFAGCFADPRFIDGDFTRRFITPLVQSAHHMRGAMDLIDTFEQHHVDDLKAAHARLKFPVQLIWGSDDSFFPAEKARAMLPQFPDAQLHVIEGGRLFIHEEYPDVFAEICTAALRRGFGAATEHSANAEAAA